jgi:serine/threonine-protein kinase
MATVYRAYDTDVGRTVALKVLLPHLRYHQEFAQRFKREGRNATALQHPAIVPIYDSSILEGYPYLAMEYLEGGSLSDWMDQHQGPFPLRQAAGILSQIASALDYAHQRGVIHRDVKPSNILLTREGEAKLGDFGIARAVWDSRLTQSGTHLGTPAYMAPEQARGQDANRRTDVYALGIVLYELITGQPPFQGNTTAVLYQHVHEPPPSPRRLNSRLPRRAERVILKALAKQPDQRYQSTGQLAKAFRAAIGLAQTQPSSNPNPDPSTATPSSPSPPSTHSGQNGFLILLALTAVVTLVGALAFGLSHPNPITILVPGSTNTPQSIPTITDAAPTEPPATSTPHLSLQLLGPEDGSVFYSYQDVTLSWQEVTLEPDQRFYVELRNSKTGQRVPRQLTTEGTQYTLPTLDIASYRWRVRMEEDVEGQWKIISRPSTWRTFRIVPPPTPTPTPPPTSNRADGGDDKPQR